MTNSLSVVLIGPDGEGRRALLDAFSGHQITVSGELGAYQNFDHLLKLAEIDCDVVVVELDRDPDAALDLVETICSRLSQVTVMVYSASRDPELLVRCMRAGAREFIGHPIDPEGLAEAMVRAAARRVEVGRQKKVGGKVLTFWGAKGGIGVTTLAANFAIALKKLSGKEVVLVDLRVQLGDVAVVMGLAPVFSVSDALRNSSRLDEELVVTMLTEHPSGVMVLAAPDQYQSQPAVEDGHLGKLLYVLRNKFPYVVVDAGPGLGAGADAIFETADAVYLVAGADIPCLRNTERMIAHLRRPGAHESRLELVLNRFDPRHAELDPGRIAKAVGLEPKWRVPNDYSSVRRSLDAGSPLALGNSPVSRAVHHMAWEACGRPPVETKKRKWGLF